LFVIVDLNCRVVRGLVGDDLGFVSLVGFLDLFIDHVVSLAFFLDLAFFRLSNLEALSSDLRSNEIFNIRTELHFPEFFMRL
jgi:hypothetical protein